MAYMLGVLAVAGVLILAYQSRSASGTGQYPVWTSALAVVAVGALFYFGVFMPERLDQTCPDGGYTVDRSRCGPGHGTVYEGSKPQPGDSPAALLNKIAIAASLADREVIWRRALMVAAISVGLIALLRPGTFNANEGLILGLAIFVTAYGMASFTTYHHHKYPANHILEAVALLQKQ